MLKDVADRVTTWTIRFARDFYESTDHAWKEWIHTWWPDRRNKNRHDLHIESDQDFFHTIGLSSLSNPTAEAREGLLSRFNKILSWDFGLQLYFAERAYGSEEGPHSHREISAYLAMLPQRTANNLIVRDGEVVSGLLPTDEMLVPYSHALKRKFEVALKRLGLEPRMGFRQVYQGDDLTWRKLVGTNHGPNRNCNEGALLKQLIIHW